MIIHNCINCDYMEFIPICPHPPIMQKYICPSCGTVQWIYHSRLSPCTYSDDMVQVDEKSQTVKLLER